MGICLPKFAFALSSIHYCGQNRSKIFKFFYCFKCSSSRAGTLFPLSKPVIYPIHPTPARSDSAFTVILCSSLCSQGILLFFAKLSLFLSAERSVNDRVMVSERTKDVSTLTVGGNFLLKGEWKKDRHS